ncbi:MAG TPA: tRNA (N6-threonylcarbamoyladenosine(37)-N6)-methyltransferase TrmO [Roseiflexaceae bacterium]|nr:tRNA (N6-threonylcarbamoyladenosine(37)-N6)-methyltransferase TrmO [Roseiflexaceae bacterium]
MRYLVMHKSNEDNEAGVPPSKELIEEMGKLMEQAAKSGVLLAAEGVHASSKGARVSFSGGKRTITDGPFAEAKELIAGFAILDVPSKAEAIEWATRFAKVIGDVEIEIRQVVEQADFAPETVSPEAAAHAQAVQDALERNASATSHQVEPIGVIRSELTTREAAPLQGDEGAPEAWLVLNPQVAQGLAGIKAGDELIVLTWFHRARRDTLQVHPRGDQNAPLTGVFATRSPNRPNPVGLHRVSVQEVAGERVRVGPIEAIDGTPIVDIKPVLGRLDER